MVRGCLLDRQKHVAADHHPGQALLGGALARDGADLLAAAQHGDPVGHLQHLVELVADEHDPGAVLLEPVEHADQLVHLLCGEDSSGLIQDEDASFAVQGAQDLDPLLRADRHVLDRCVGIDGQAVAVRQLAHAHPRGVQVEQTAGR